MSPQTRSQTHSFRSAPLPLHNRPTLSSARLSPRTRETIRPWSPHHDPSRTLIDRRRRYRPKPLNSLHFPAKRLLIKDTTKDDRIAYLENHINNLSHLCAFRHEEKLFNTAPRTATLSSGRVMSFPAPETDDEGKIVPGTPLLGYSKIGPHEEHARRLMALQARGASVDEARFWEEQVQVQRGEKRKVEKESGGLKAEVKKLEKEKGRLVDRARGAETKVTTLEKKVKEVEQKVKDAENRTKGTKSEGEIRILEAEIRRLKEEKRSDAVLVRQLRFFLGKDGDWEVQAQWERDAMAVGGFGGSRLNLAGFGGF